VVNVRRTDAFACLQSDWGGAYRFEYWPGTHKAYRAFRLDDDTELSAQTPEELRESVRSDYLRRPVPREAAPVSRESESMTAEERPDAC
jgi:hypothetical protein